MKNLLFTIFLFSIALSGTGQFVSQPLNYPGPGYWPYFYSIVDQEHMWIGTIHESGLPCPFSVKTMDGGDTWIFDTIPVQGNPGCVSVCGWDTSVCFYVFSDMDGIIDPSIWKTTDGGTTWSNIVTSQFSGGFINFYHAFSADTGIAVGDPTEGYFEIQVTYDGGTTWSRIPSTDIPAILNGEMGLYNSYSGVGNSIWFTTSKSRCFRSSDRGLTWDVTTIFPGLNTDLGICFSTEQKGAIWNRAANDNSLVVTDDGGLTWDTVSFPTGYYIQDMSRVPGWEGGFVVTAYKNLMRVYFTPDMFSSLQVLDPGILSTGAVEFYDVATGWLAGGESGNNEIYKFDWVLNVEEKVSDAPKLSILPNPSSGPTLVKLSGVPDTKEKTVIITDMTGKVVLRCPVPDGDFSLPDASLFPNGVYLVEVKTGNTTLARQRWVVNH